MKVAILCEFSGIVRDAFLSAGHDTISCDLEPTERPGPHIQGDCREYDWSRYDLVIAHPPCTHTACSGARWFSEKKKDGRQKKAIEFFMWFTRLENKRIVIEHPISIMSTLYRKPDQIIQPWQFGHEEKKAICLWLKGVKKLEPTKIMKKRFSRIHYMGSSKKNRSRERSRFFPGIAKAMTEQWF
jgi:site-specific DNA-cytosine methylase